MYPECIYIFANTCNFLYGGEHVDSKACCGHVSFVKIQCGMSMHCVNSRMDAHKSWEFCIYSWVAIAILVDIHHVLAVDQDDTYAQSGHK